MAYTRVKRESGRWKDCCMRDKSRLQSSHHRFRHRTLLNRRSASAISRSMFDQLMYKLYIPSKSKEVL